MKTDSQIQHDVIEELHWEPAVNATQIGVEVVDGIVTLAGQVGSFSEKWIAETAVQRVTGVRGLAMDVQVALPGMAMRSDTDIARTAENVLQWTSIMPLNAIKVVVENGWVTLRGEVAWNYQRQYATDAVRHLMGVTGVSCQISLAPPLVSSAAVKEGIEVALKRRAIVDAAQIQVAIEGTEVTLSGRVQTWAERQLAEHAAWGIPGVRKVVDKLVIA